MAAQHRGRDLMSNSENSTEVEHAAKRHAPFQWPMMGEHGNISDSNMINPVQFANNMWNPQAQQMMPPLMPGFTPMIPKNEEEARQLVAMQAAMMASGQFGQFPQVAPGNNDNDIPNQQNDQTQALGDYPADPDTLKEHIIYETELYEDLRERITEHGHFCTMVSLLDKYFKGALSSETRSQMAQLIQDVIDDKSTSVDESRKLKHVLEGIKNPMVQVHTIPKADETYFQQLSDAQSKFAQNYAQLRKVK